MEAKKKPATETKRWKILLVDDHPVLRQGLAELIREEPDMLVCGEADNGADALKMIRERKPDLAIVDLVLSSYDGMELVKQISSGYPDVAVLVLSIHDESAYAERCLRAGARGYVMKREAASQVMTAIRQVLSGQVYASHAVTARLLERVSGNQLKSDASPLSRLSDRELQVFRCIGQGLGMREIAERLFLSVKTIEAHREHIKQKFQLRTSGELRQFAIQMMRDEH